MQYNNVTNDRQMRALTRLSVSQFEMLEREFSEEYKKKKFTKMALAQEMQQRRLDG